MSRECWDTIVVGAGPAGLSSAIYSSRFRRHTLVLHDGTSRAHAAPWVRNLAGFQDGVAGSELLEKMGQQATRYGAQIQTKRVETITALDNAFQLVCAGGDAFRAKTLILATGLQLGDEPLAGEQRRAAIDAGVLRYCPVCDGFEQTGRKVAIYTDGDSGAAEALFLRHFTDQVVVALTSEGSLDPACASELRGEGIRVLTNARISLKNDRQGFVITSSELAAEEPVDVLYPSFGCRARSELVTALGLAVNHLGCVSADAPLGTTIPGLFCAGDLVEGLDQIAVAVGHGALAATRAHKYLREQK